jgi:hypothetical protein
MEMSSTTMNCAMQHTASTTRPGTRCAVRGFACMAASDQRTRGFSLAINILALNLMPRGRGVNYFNVEELY